MSVRERKKKSKLPLIIGIVVLLLVLLLGVRSVRNRVAQARTEYETFVVATGTIVRTVSGAGRVVTINKEMLYAVNGGQLQKVNVVVGSTVEQGDVLMRTAAGAEIRAPFAGEITSLLVRENEWINPGTRLLEITDYNNLDVSALVDELDVAKLRVGQAALIDINAFEGEDLQGAIKSIAREGTLSGGITTFAIKVSIEDITNVRVGMSAEIRVETNRVQNVLVIPVEAVYYDNDIPYVMIRGNANAVLERTTVAVGLSDGRHVEIKDGLTAGQTVVYKKTTTAQRGFTGPFGRIR